MPNAQIIIEETPKPSPFHAFKRTDWRVDAISRFHYSTQATKLYGRAVEQQQLIDFCLLEPTQAFKWWLIAGKGGSGKNRLALEHGLWLEKYLSWDVFLLASFEPTDYEFKRNTLIIIDYASVYVEDVRRVLLALARRTPPFAVRVLLLERMVDAPWYQQLTLGSSQTDNAALDATRHAAPLTLPPLGMEHAAQIVQDMQARYNCANSIQNLPQLIERLRIEQRPLYLLLLADALVKSPQTTQWNAETLIKTILAAQLHKWQAAGVTPADLELLRFVTMVGGVNLDSTHQHDYIEQLFQKVGLDADNAAFRQRWANFEQSDLTHELKGLEPDLLGELFVLNHYDDRTERQWAQTHWQSEWLAAWQQPERLISFMGRTAQDFVTHPNFANLLRACKATGQDEPELYWIDAFICDAWCKHGDLVQAQEVWEQLKGNPEFTAQYLVARLAVNLISAYKAQPAVAQQIYDELKQLRSTHGFAAHVEMAIEQAKAAFNLINAYQAQPAAAQQIYDELKQLRSTHGFAAHVEMATCQAEAAVNLISAYEAQPAAAQQIYDELKQLRSTHGFAAHVEMAIEQAKAAVNLISAYQAQLAVAQQIYDELKQLRSTHGFAAHVEMAIEQAKAAVNLISAYKAQPAAAQQIYDDLKQLRSTHGFAAHVEMATRQANAAFNLIIAYQAQPAAAQRIYDELKQLRSTHGFAAHVEMAIEQAKAAVNLTNAYNAQPAVAQQIYDELKQLRSTHGFAAHVEMAIEQANAAVNLISAYKAQPVAAQQIYDELKQLRSEHGFAAYVEMAIVQAQAAVNLISAYKTLPAAAQQIYDELKQLRSEHGFASHVKMATCQAGAAFILSMLIPENTDYPAVVAALRAQFAEVEQLFQQRGL
ncbi:MAG: hypothetical protein ACRCV6_00410 [Formosimonas sp.]